VGAATEDAPAPSTKRQPPKRRIAGQYLREISAGSF